MITKIEKMNWNIRTVIKTLETMYNSAALVVECNSRVTGMVGMEFTPGIDDKCSITVHKIASSTTYKYVLSKESLKSCTLDTGDNSVKLIITTKEFSTCIINLYFLTYIIPEIAQDYLPKTGRVPVFNNGITVARRINYVDIKAARVTSKICR